MSGDTKIFLQAANKLLPNLKFKQEKLDDQGSLTFLNSKVIVDKDHFRLILKTHFHWYNSFFHKLLFFKIYITREG